MEIYHKVQNDYIFLFFYDNYLNYLLELQQPRTYFIFI